VQGLGLAAIPMIFSACANRLMFAPVEGYLSVIEAELREVERMRIDLGAQPVSKSIP